MFGLIIGTLCLFALIATLRGRHHGHFAPFGYHRRGYPGHWGGGYHDYADYPGAGNHRRGRRRFAVRWLFEQLDTTPGQEKAIMKSLETLQEQLASGRGELGAARKELAQALGGDVLDQSALTSALSKVDGLFDKARTELTHSLTEVHTALDGKQRKLLAELIADFPSYGFGHGRC
jgi:Spy/CpxP family protein refolding chaperone